MTSNLEFNAKREELTDLVERFVRPVYFDECSAANHTCLFGPRGSGKTTILRMLQPTSLRLWAKTRGKTDALRILKLFHAIWLPTDIVWEQTLQSVLREGAEEHSPVLWRAMFLAQTATSVIASLRADFDWTKVDGKAEYRAARLCASACQIEAQSVVDLRSLEAELRQQLTTLGSRLPRLVKKRTLPERLPFVGLPILKTTQTMLVAVDSALGSEMPDRWALCFDELELAHPSIREELIGGLRNFSDPRFLLKLALTPINPEFAHGHVATHADYSPVALWNNNPSEWRTFAREFLDGALDSRGRKHASPDRLLGSSAFAYDDRRSYQAGGYMQKQFSSLAKVDPSFKEWCERREIDPNHPGAREGEGERATVRKLRSVVIARNFHLKSSKEGVTRRSRKTVALDLYKGWPSIVDITMGNPRYLRALLSDLFGSEQVGKVPDVRQAKAIGRVNDIYSAYLETWQIRREDGRSGETLAHFLDHIGGYFNQALLSRTFDPEPPGTFVVDNPTPSITEFVRIASDIGAIVPLLSDSSLSRHSSIANTRFRLGNIVAARYGLPLETLGSVRLSVVLRGYSPGQLPLF